MTKGRETKVLAIVLGGGFFLFGLEESGVALADSSSIVFFWVPALCGGGILILLCVFKVEDPNTASRSLVVIGALQRGCRPEAWWQQKASLARRSRRAGVVVVMAAGTAAVAAAPAPSRSRGMVSGRRTF